MSNTKAENSPMLWLDEGARRVNIVHGGKDYALGKSAVLIHCATAAVQNQSRSLVGHLDR